MVGRYEILDELGRGGMAIVYLARQTDLERPVALKELSSFRQSDPAFVQRFLRESRLAGSLSHPNIVTVYDYLEEDRTPYIAMEYVEGGTLRDWIGHVSLTQAAGVLEGMLSALDAAERREIVHRDLKPENVMVSTDGRVKITDFGIAKATGTVQGSSMLTATGMTVGTPNYMAPEQAMGKEVGPWTDLYSVGVMAFELFVGKVPFAETEEPLAVLMRQVSDPIPAARSLNAELDQGISDWIGTLLVKDPKKRTRSAAEAWDGFEEIVLRLIGPRWRRSARLVDPSRRHRDVPAGPLTPPPTVAATPPMTSLGSAPTRRLRDSQLTIAPPTRRMTRDTGATEAAARPRSSARRVAKLALPVCALLIALAAALGRSAVPDSPPEGQAAATPVDSIAGRDMELRVPRGWSAVRRPPSLGLPLKRATAVAPRGRGDSGPVVEFGMARGRSAANPSLLPAAFLSSIGRAPDDVPARSAVRLPVQGLQAWRYRDQQPVGVARTVTVYTVPSSAGVATIACAAPPGRAAALAATCDAIAGTLRLRHGHAYPVGPSKAYASALNTHIGQLQATVRVQQANLEAAQTLGGQAAADDALAQAYGQAASQLSALKLSPADRDGNARLVTALNDAASAYRKAAQAARGGDADAYRAASAAVPAAVAEVNTALTTVRGSGYQPDGGGSASGSTPGGGSTDGGGSAGASTDGGSGGDGANGSPDGGSAPDGESDSSGSSSPETGSDSGVGDSRSDDPSDDQEEN